MIGCKAVIIDMKRKWNFFLIAMHKKCGFTVQSVPRSDIKNKNDQHWFQYKKVWFIEQTAKLNCIQTININRWHGYKSIRGAFTSFYFSVYPISKARPHSISVNHGYNISDFETNFESISSKDSSFWWWKLMSFNWYVQSFSSRLFHL